MNDPNQIPGATAKAALQYLAEQLVDEPEEIEISASQWRQRVSLNLSVAPDDMGKIIGRKGRTAQSVRTVVRAIGARDGHDIHLDIVD